MNTGLTVPIKKRQHVATSPAMGLESQVSSFMPATIKTEPCDDSDAVHFPPSGDNVTVTSAPSVCTNSCPTSLHKSYCEKLKMGSVVNTQTPYQFLVKGESDPDWPLLGAPEDTDADGSGSLAAPETWDSQEWKEQFQGLEKMDRYFNLWKCEYFHLYHDVKFQVGPQKTPFSAHKLLLLSFCKNSSFRASVNSSAKDGLAICLPSLDPGAVSEVFCYMYSCKLGLKEETVGQVYEVAKTFGLPELLSKCIALIQSNVINCDNVLQLFCDALKSKDERLVRATAAYITRNVKDVVFSDSFLQLSEESLYLFLKSDDWYIDDEMQIFEAVKRWATHKLSLRGTVTSDEEIRKTIGRGFYEIRFCSLESLDIFWRKICSDHEKLFTLEERNEISTYILLCKNQSQLNNPPRSMKFNFKPRQKKNRLGVSIPFEENRECDDYVTNTVKVEGHTESELIVDEKTTLQQGEEDDGVYQPPPKKMKKCDDGALPVDNTLFPSPPPSPNEVPFISTSSHEASLEKQATLPLSELVKTLATSKDFGSIDKISKVVKLTIIPRETRVYLPNLKEVELQIIPNNQRSFECGSALKGYIKSKFASLSDILFFDKIKRQPNTASQSYLSQLLDSKIDISITCEKTFVLKINHEQGLILMSLLKDAQEIINGASEFPLKILAVSECELFTLDPVRTENLEVIVMRRVRGLKNNTVFLASCTKLKTVSWNDLGMEDIDITERLLDGNQLMTKLALSKCKLSVTGNLSEHGNFLRELYLDNCGLRQDLMKQFSKLFPFVKRVQLYGKKCDARMVYYTLQMESLEWLFVWEYTHVKVKVKSSKKKRGSAAELTQESKEMQDFLKMVFDEEFAKKDKITFMLEKKNSLEGVPCTSSSAIQRQKSRNPFEPTSWSGTKLKTVKEKYSTVTELDFKNFSYNTFFENYEAFAFVESTESDTKKRKQRRESIPASNVISLDVQPPSNSSTDDSVDILANNNNPNNNEQ